MAVHEYRRDLHYENFTSVTNLQIVLHIEQALSLLLLTSLMAFNRILIFTILAHISFYDKHSYSFLELIHT